MIGRKQLLAPALAAGAGIFMLAGSLAAQQPTSTAAEAPTCTATFAPQTLKTQKDPFQLRAALSQQIGEVSAVSVQEQGSGVQVALAQPGAANAAQAAAEPATEEATQPAPVQPPTASDASKTPTAEAQPAAPAADAAASAAQVVWLNLDASVAKAGAYTVQIQGANGTCSGQITIGAPDQGSK